MLAEKDSGTILGTGKGVGVSRDSQRVKVGGGAGVVTGVESDEFGS